MMNQSEDMHPDDRRNLIIFIAIAVLVWLGFDHFVLQPQQQALRQSQQIAVARQQTPPSPDDSTIARLERDALVAQDGRIVFENDHVRGSFSLVGARIDDLVLKNYRQTLNGPDNVVLLSPSGTNWPIYAETGWLAADKNMPVPGEDTRWRVAGNGHLTPDSPVTLYWENGKGLRFERVLTLDQSYMIQVAQRVVNKGGETVTLYPYSLVAQHGLPREYFNMWVVHEGPIGFIGGDLHEYSYKKMRKDVGQKVMNADTGWIGITQKYWFVGLIPDQAQEMKFRFLHTDPPTSAGRHRYQSDVVGAAQTIAPGESAQDTARLFAGPKKLDLLSHYEDTQNAPHFDLALDFGMYYFMTKPLFVVLHYFGDLTGNYGIAIILLTILIRICVFPLANTSFRSFAKLREIGPKMTALREKHGDDREKLQQEIVRVYREEKVNPMAGCLPIIIQIPIFFALYKVVLISIELRHAPFFGWIYDLSAPDPTSVFNLFGLIPWNPPAMLMIGAWPCLMLVFMLLQKTLNPPPQDKTQAIILNVMPFMVTVLLAGMASGLVIYWTFSNALSILQQYILMRSMGVEVHLFKRSDAEKELAKKVKDGPTIHPGLEVLEEKAEEAIEGALIDDAPAISPPKRKTKKKK